MTSQAAEAHTNGMWRIVWKLLSLRMLILVSGFRRAKTSRKILIFLASLGVLIFLGTIFFISWSLLRFLGSPKFAEMLGGAGDVLESVPVLILSGAFLGILFTSFGVLLQALYLAGDMDFLLSAPIPIRAVFISKLLQAILPNFGLICLFALPVLFGLGASRSYSLLYYPCVIVVLSALALAAAGISSLLVMAAVRVFPARRVAELLGFLGGTLTLICSQSGQIANWAEFSPQQGQQAVAMITRFNTPWSPAAWVWRGLSLTGEALSIGGLGITAATLIACVLIFAGALVAAERLYYTGWAGINSTALKKRPARQTRAAPITRETGNFLRRMAPEAVVEIVQKDVRMLRRDMRNMSQLITPLIVGVFYFVMLLRGGEDMIDGAGQAPAWMSGVFESISTYSNVGLSLFVGWMLLSRLAGMGFSQEGKNYWLLKTAPVSTRQLIGSKFLVAYLPVLTLCLLFLLVTWLVRRSDLGILFFSIPVVALAIGGNAGINLAFGIIGANFEWEDPRKMQRGASGCLSVIASMVYLPLCLGLFFGPAIILTALQLPAIAGQAGGLALGGLFSLACAVIPLWLVRKRVASLSEPG
jgi:ABC-2 type transport system permease protein